MVRTIWLQKIKHSFTDDPSSHLYDEVMVAVGDFCFICHQGKTLLPNARIRLHTLV